MGVTPEGGEEVEGLDVRGAAIGTEGMFGIVTRVLVKLIRAPQAYRTLLGIFETVEDAGLADATAAAEAISVLDISMMNLCEFL